MSLAEEVAARKAQRRSLEEARQDRLDAEMRERQDKLDAWALETYKFWNGPRDSSMLDLVGKLFGFQRTRKAP